MTGGVEALATNRIAVIGRDRAIAHFREALDELKNGHGRFLLVGAEAGVGKTRLCEEAAIMAAGAYG